jgi:hypothetical protein
MSNCSSEGSGQAASGGPGTPEKQVEDLPGRLRNVRSGPVDGCLYVPLPGDGTQFESRAVKVLHRSETMVAIEGIDAGIEVALVHPASVRAIITASEPPAATAGVSK